VTKEERTDFKVGLTVLAGITLLLIGIGWAKGWGFGGEAETHKAVFLSAGGLEKGDPVTVNGVKLGTVEGIELRQSSVVVTMGFSKHVDLRRDASASISMLELMGGKKVELTPGSASEPLPTGTMIPGNNNGDISTLVGMVTSLSGTLASITGKTDTLFTSLNSVLEGDGFKTKLNHTLDVADGALLRLDGTAGRVNALLTQNGPTLSRALSQADSTMRQLSSIIAENRPGLRVFVDSGSRAIADARRSLGRLDSLLINAGRENTFMYRLTRDTSFAMRLDSALTSLGKLSEQIRLQGIDANIRFFNSSKPVK